VLLIIFIITTPLLDNGLDLKLPVGGLQDKRKRTRMTFERLRSVSKASID
jgi:biopolymer transport protein ExbD